MPTTFWQTTNPFMGSNQPLVNTRASVYIRTVSSYQLLYALLNWFKLDVWLEKHALSIQFLPSLARKESNVMLPNLKTS